MKTIKLTIFSILGATLLGLGLYSCSNDDTTGVNELEKTNVSKNVNRKTNDRFLKEEDIYKITNFTIENTNEIISRIDLIKPVNGIDYILISKDSKSNTIFSRFINENDNIKNIYTKDGIYDYSFKYSNDNELITFRDQNLINSKYTTLGAENCYDKCMGDAKYNWVADSNGKPSDGLERAMNELTWKTVGENVAIVLCGACCSGLVDCPERAKPNVITEPGLIIEIPGIGDLTEILVPNLNINIYE